MGPAPIGRDYYKRKLFIEYNILETKIKGILIIEKFYNSYGNFRLVFEVSYSATSTQFEPKRFKGAFSMRTKIFQIV